MPPQQLPRQIYTHVVTSEPEYLAVPIVRAFWLKAMGRVLYENVPPRVYLIDR